MHIHLQFIGLSLFPGEPEPQIDWYKDEEHLKPKMFGGRVDISWDDVDKVSTLEVRHVTSQDAGEYTAKATNPGGCITASVDVLVDDTAGQRDRGVSLEESMMLEKKAGKLAPEEDDSDGIKAADGQQQDVDKSEDDSRRKKKKPKPVEVDADAVKAGDGEDLAKKGDDDSKKKKKKPKKKALEDEPAESLKSCKDTGVQGSDDESFLTPKKTTESESPVGGKDLTDKGQQGEAEDEEAFLTPKASKETGTVGAEGNDLADKAEQGQSDDGESFLKPKASKHTGTVPADEKQMKDTGQQGESDEEPFLKPRASKDTETRAQEEKDLKEKGQQGETDEEPFLKPMASKDTETPAQEEKDLKEKGQQGESDEEPFLKPRASKETATPATDKKKLKDKGEQGDSDDDSFLKPKASTAAGETEDNGSDLADGGDQTEPGDREKRGVSRKDAGQQASDDEDFLSPTKRGGKDKSREPQVTDVNGHVGSDEQKTDDTDSPDTKDSAAGKVKRKLSKAKDSAVTNEKQKAPGNDKTPKEKSGKGKSKKAKIQENELDAKPMGDKSLAPTFVQKPKNISVDEGEVIRIECKIKGARTASCLLFVAYSMELLFYK